MASTQKQTFDKIIDKLEYIENNDDEITMRDIFPNGIPDSIYYFILSEDFEKLKKRFGSVPPELAERYPNGFPEEIKELFRNKTPIEVMKMFRKGVPEPLKNIFPNGVPESLKQRYSSMPEEISRHFNKQDFKEIRDSMNL